MITTSLENSTMREVQDCQHLIKELLVKDVTYLDIHPMPTNIKMKYKVVHDNYNKSVKIISKPNDSWTYKDYIRLMTTWLHHLPKDIIERYTFNSIYKSLEYSLESTYKVQHDFKSFVKYYMTFIDAFSLREGKEDFEHQLFIKMQLTFEHFVEGLKVLKQEEANKLKKLY